MTEYIHRNGHLPVVNFNRQIMVTRKTVGIYKADVMKERMQEINPDVEVNVHRKIGPLATGATVSARRVQNINARSVGIFRKGSIRFSVGLEDPDDIIRDLDQALKAIGL